jgi:aspartokinase/homoserine dehydrogenase 1
VLANKVPLAADRASAERLQRTARLHGRRILHEATVGAGLPVLDTLRKLQEAGDTILSIEGCPSGTLGFLFGELGRGRSFSSALRAAIAAGYTEPEPRIDLSGLDVARKALILARLIGFTGDLTHIAVDSLVPHALSGVPVTDFLERLDELDELWAGRARAAREKGAVLRYRARATPTSVTVGLVEVAESDALGSLQGTDNQFAFVTQRYREQPLIIRGPGAGSEVTAAGVFNDLLRLVAERDGTGRERRASSARRDRDHPRNSTAVFP